MTKKIFIAMLLVLGVMAFAEASYDQSTTAQAKAVAENTAKTAVSQIPIPTLSYFTERKTIAAWYQRWDKPSVITYVYLINYGNILGYYVCNGKPASTRSTLNPEYIQEAYGNSNGYTSIEKQQQDLDGTYGENNPGIRFFTADGAAVEYGGNIAYLYSDVKLPINVPLFNVAKK